MIIGAIVPHVHNFGGRQVNSPARGGKESGGRLTPTNFGADDKRPQTTQLAEARHHAAQPMIVVGCHADDETTVATAMKHIDKAAANGVIHKNAAARRKSRLMKALSRKRG